MPKRKKYPKLPNGFGCIKYLGNNRKNPYAIHPPTTEFKENGSPVTPKAIAYVDSWYYGFAILMAHKAGTYIPGEYPPKPDIVPETKDLGCIIKNLLADYLQVTKQNSDDENECNSPTFKDVFEGYYKFKYEEDKSKKYSQSSMKSTQAAFRNCAVLHDLPFKDLRHDDLQNVLKECTLKHASHELILTLFHQMYDYAIIKEICKDDYSARVKILIPDDDEKGEPFTDKDLKILWSHKEDPIAEFILIMCYSGYRIEAYQKIEVYLEERYFKGGVKNATSKNRIVPIHSAIYPLVERRMKLYGKILPEITQTFRDLMYAKLEELGIKKHTPHDCRHTFSCLCEKFGVRENDRKRMLGHAFQDVTNRVYGHRELDDLRKEIEKIKICY